MDEALRIDVLLHRLCLTRSRNEAKTACDAGAVLVEGRRARPSEEVSAGQTVTIRFPRRLFAFELQQVPPRSTSKKSAREMYRVVQDEPIEL